MKHYSTLIKMFGAPNGLCSSITESRHIKAVKEPWRRSNRYEALGQMLVTNQRLDKLAAARVDYSMRGMLRGPLQLVPPVADEQNVHNSDNDDDDAVSDPPVITTFDVQLARQHGMCASSGRCMAQVGLTNCSVRGLPRTAVEVAIHFGYEDLVPCVRRFLYDQRNPDAEVPGDRVDLNQCPQFDGELKVYKSATATYYAPCDQSGMGGMHRDIIRCTPSWRGGGA